MLNRTILVVCLVVALFVPSAALSQSTDKPSIPLKVAWDDGLVIESGDGAYRLQLGALVRFDGRAIADDPPPAVADAFALRNARLNFQGKLGKYVSFHLVPDFAGNNTPAIADAYVEVNLSDAVHARFGRFKVPIGYEVLLQDANVWFLERGPSANLMPLRDTGAELYGNLHHDLVSYAVGVFNGQVDGAGNSANTAETNSAKDLVGRLSVRPFRGGNLKALDRLSVAVGGSRGEPGPSELPSFKTSAQQTYFSYDKSAIATGVRTRVSPQVSYYFHAFGAYAEYARSREGVSRQTSRADITNTAWQVVGSFILTGETAGEAVHPKHVFDPEQHRWGALQLTARYGELDVDPSAFTLAFADANASGHAQIASIGAIWILTHELKGLLNVERTVFDHDPAGARQAEHALLARLQVNF